MFVLKILAFFILITISIVGFIASLDNSKLIVIPLVCVPLALYIVGYISRFAPIGAKVKDYKEEVELRKSSGYKYRRIFVGLFAIGFGSLILYLYISTDGGKDPEVLIGAFMFIILGGLSILRRNTTKAPIASPEVQRALMKEAFEESDISKQDEALRYAAESAGHSKEYVDELIEKSRTEFITQARETFDKTLDETDISAEDRAEMKAEFEQLLSRYQVK